jgi:cellulose synthase/poly-beta-1,6-N-acetylglucosamine synthase-like glycosyltransferase
MTVSPRLPDSPRMWSAQGENRARARSISVIITAFAEDRWYCTIKAVASALRQSPPPREVILVIDHNPRLAERARAELDGVAILENVGPTGASAARNTGVVHSRGDIVVFLDDDQVAVTPDWLRCLCRHFADPTVVGVGGGITPDWQQVRPRWFPREFDWVVGASYTGMPETVAPIRNVWGGNSAIRRAAFDAVGGFRAGFGKTGRVSRPEDTDLCIRVQQALPSGYWLYDPVAEVAHTVPLDRSTPVFFLKRCWNEGRGKAALVRFIGMDASMASERRYTTRVLPRAFLRELRTAILRRDISSLERCGAILSGFVLTLAGWVTEMLVGARR